ncbi:MAG: SpoIID/LytB domain-containing protein [Oscillospiraceae bacterium]|nr:SpoIID/LytB domain-containing protein [Oscillospiraceae bacterium]
MGFAKKFTRFIAVLLVVCVALPFALPLDASANIPARRTLRIGLNYGTTALPSANFINGVGSGYEFGFYDANLVFHPVAATAETRISVMIDHNMQWNPSAEFSGQYFSVGTGAPAAGSAAVGFIHWRISSGHANAGDAYAQIAEIPDGFIRYNAGHANPFMPIYGNYTSDTEANAARRSVHHTRDAGTARTITVAVMGTGNVIFEFDNTANPALIFGIRPINDARPSTHFRGDQYFGGFRFERRVSTALTVVNIVELEDYVQGVVPYEMSPNWPLEALKAQAICARTYALSQLNKHNTAHGFDLCNTMDCQVYRGRNNASNNSNTAVTSTAGMVVTYNGALAQTFYVSSHGGASENNENIWAGTPLPYLRGVIDDYEDRIASLISNYNWTITISQEDITARVRNAGHAGASTIATLRVSQYSPTGNVVSVVATDTNGRDYTFSRRAGLQSLFGATPLRSQRFNIGAVTWQPGSAIFVNMPALSVNLNQYSAITGSGVSAVSGSLMAIDGSGNIVNVAGGGPSVTEGAATGPVNGNFIVNGRGWGHSVGMSQWGAYSQALHFGRTAQQIIQHYFTGVQITTT